MVMGFDLIVLLSTLKEVGGIVKVPSAFADRVYVYV
jgi:hypothetical protein